MTSKIDLKELGYPKPKYYTLRYKAFVKFYGQMLGDVVSSFNIPVFYEEKQLKIIYPWDGEVDYSIQSDINNFNE